MYLANLGVTDLM